MESIGLLIIVICILLAAAISRRIRGTIITLPMVYTLFGILLGGLVLDLVPLTPDDIVVELIAELTLVLVLATDASRIDVRTVIRDNVLPTRLLAIGLPLTILFGTVAAVLIFTDLSLWEAAILGIVLAPTDASLGQSVVSHPKVPVRIRQTLNIESGLNDGIAVPFLLLAISLAESEFVYNTALSFAFSALGQIILGIMIGVVIGYLGVKYIEWGQKSGWMSGDFRKLSSLALILLAYGGAEVIGGNGFIAAFVFGLVSGNLAGKKETEDLYEHTEVEVALLMLLTFVLFGAVMLPPAIEFISPAVLIYAVISLTLVRMLAVAIGMIGEKLRPVTTLFLGWFGPRGIASILYAFIVLEHETLPGRDLIYAVAMVTVLISIYAHGITAAPASDRYGQRMETMLEDDEFEMMEHEQVPEMPLRAGGN